MHHVERPADVQTLAQTQRKSRTRVEAESLRLVLRHENGLGAVPWFEAPRAVETTARAPFAAPALVPDGNAARAKFFYSCEDRRRPLPPQRRPSPKGRQTSSTRRDGDGTVFTRGRCSASERP